MPYAIDAATKLHEKQLAAATKGQELFVMAVEKVADLREQAPKAPASVTHRLDTFVAPITKIVGTRSEVNDYVTRTAREWLALQQQFQARILEILGVKSTAKPASSRPRKSTSKSAASKSAAIA